jgi:hypothetical protein
MPFPQNITTLAEATNEYSLAVARPVLLDPFGDPTEEQGFMVRLSDLKTRNVVFVGKGLTLEKAIENLAAV